VAGALTHWKAACSAAAGDSRTLAGALREEARAASGSATRSAREATRNGSGIPPGTTALAGEVATSSIRGIADRSACGRGPGVSTRDGIGASCATEAGASRISGAVTSSAGDEPRPRSGAAGPGRSAGTALAKAPASRSRGADGAGSADRSRTTAGSGDGELTIAGATTAAGGSSAGHAPSHPRIGTDGGTSAAAVPRARAAIVAR
jgi:hypothetical protein